MDCAKGPCHAPFFAPQEQDKLSLEKPFGQSINANGQKTDRQRLKRLTTLEPARLPSTKAGPAP